MIGRTINKECFSSTPLIIGQADTQCIAAQGIKAKYIEFPLQ
jgi:hypothetical protein